MDEFLAELKTVLRKNDLKELGQALGLAHIRSFEKIPGDASTRQYFRVQGDHGTRYILMKTDPFLEHGEKFPFLSVQKHLFRCDISVPEIYYTDPEKGFILLEDLGDVTLLRRLQNVNTNDVERSLYERVIDRLVDLQVKATPDAEKKFDEIDAFRLRFDVEKLMWEVKFTVDNFYKLYLKRSIRSADEKVILDGFQEICEILARQPTVLTHRDFHSRNIMVTPSLKTDEKKDRFVIIDFQDARMGPAQYDLASLLKDSYYQLEQSQISILLDYYVARFEAMTGKVLEREEFFKVFDLMSVQRNFKAIGSFASFLNKRGDATYLKYIGNTFENIRRTLLKYSEYSALRELLFHYYYF